MCGVLREGMAQVNFLIGLLKKGWQNIKSLNIKSTMGPCLPIF